TAAYQYQSYLPQENKLIFRQSRSPIPNQGPSIGDICDFSTTRSRCGSSLSHTWLVCDGNTLVLGGQITDTKLVCSEINSNGVTFISLVTIGTNYAQTDKTLNSHTLPPVIGSSCSLATAQSKCGIQKSWLVCDGQKFILAGYIDSTLLCTEINTNGITSVSLVPAPVNPNPNISELGSSCNPQKTYSKCFGRKTLICSATGFWVLGGDVPEGQVCRLISVGDASWIVFEAANFQTITGVLKVEDLTGMTYYFGNNFNSFGEFILISNIQDAASFTLTYNNVGAIAGPLSITQSVSSKYSYLGGISGFSSTDASIQTSSFNYLYFGAVNATTELSSPQFIGNSFTDVSAISEAVESDIWYFDPFTGSISVKWVNPNGGLIDAKFVAINDGVNLIPVMVGDVNVFVNVFGGNEFTQLTLVSNEN
ncbi:hypothetical protein HK096_006207, partial [Nowakowskiella sp. JEL0078]